MKPPTHYVEITVWDSEKARSQEGSRFAAYLVWYRDAQGSNSCRHGSIFMPPYHGEPPTKLLDYVLSMATGFVQENWFLVEVGSFFRATRITTAVAVAKRLKA